MDSGFSAAEIEEFLKLINKLDAEEASLHDLPDEEFTDAYLGFRNRVENSVKHLLPYAPRDNLVSYAVNLSVESLIWTLIKATNWLFRDGIVIEARDSNVFSLDPQPFNDMVRCIMQKSVPASHYSFDRAAKFSDYRQFAEFAKNIIDVVCEAGQGPSRAIMQLNFFKAVNNIINNIGLSSEYFEVNESVSTHSVEIKKDTGCVVIATYDTSFKGTVSRSCCFSSQTVYMRVNIKVFKFSTIGDLHREFKKWLK